MFTAYAQCGTFQFACTSIRDLLNAILDSVNVLAIAIAVCFLAIGGIKYMTASGNKEKAGEAKQMLTQVLIGLAVVMGMNIIFNLMANVLGSPTSTISAPSRPQFDLQQ